MHLLTGLVCKMLVEHISHVSVEQGPDEADGGRDVEELLRSCYEMLGLVSYDGLLCLRHLKSRERERVCSRLSRPTESCRILQIEPNKVETYANASSYQRNVPAYIRHP